MGLLIILQVLLDLAFIAMATLFLIERSKSKMTEDTRLSRGLQLLSSKIAILQDLMDRSETMGRQLSQILDNKEQEIQERIEEIELHLHKVQRATEKSQEVAKIFQDRIPHQEIIERQNTIKYVQAAKMANQGFSVDDIAKQVDIPRGELDLIVKLNRDRLMVNEPEWAQEQTISKAPSHPAEFLVQNTQEAAATMSNENIINSHQSVQFGSPAAVVTTPSVSAAVAEALSAMAPVATEAPHKSRTVPASAQSSGIRAATPTPAIAATSETHDAVLFKTGAPPRKVVSNTIKPVIFKRISVGDDLG